MPREPRTRRRPRVLTVVGARPQFVKAAAISRALRERFDETLVHTGQHYDQDMSLSFFQELGIPRPDHNLAVGSGPHGRMTGRILEGLEAILTKTRPDLVVVVGDTNSTLAGALAAVKLGIPVAHVEAGLRSFDMRMPEEINRRLTDHVSSLLFCPTRTSVSNLKREGITQGVHRVGDVMLDAVLHLRERATPPPDLPTKFYVATLHRQENVDVRSRLSGLVQALDGLPLPTLMPLHPRTRARMRAWNVKPRKNLQLRSPASYLEMLALVERAEVLFTDSGGLQKEAFILRTPCVTLRETTEWVETLEGGANRLVGSDPRRIAHAAAQLQRRHPRWARTSVYGEGKAAEQISAEIHRFFGKIVAR